MMTTYIMTENQTTFTPTMEHYLDSGGSLNGSALGGPGQPPPFMPGPGVMELQLVVRQLHLYYLPIIYTIGLIGNFISVIALTDPMLRGLASTHYLVGVLVVELLYILTLFRSWSEDMSSNLEMFHFGGWCQFSTFASHVSKFLSVWYTVFLSIDCFALGCLDKKLCYPWRARIVMIAAAIVGIVVYLNVSILYGALPVGSRMVCTQLYRFKRTHEKLEEGDAFVNALIPTVIVTIVLICCSTTLHCCSRNSQKRAGFSENDLTQKLEASGQDQSQLGLRDLHMNSRQVKSCFFFLVVHIAFHAPLDGYRFYHIMARLVATEPRMPSLHGFLVDNILQHVKSTKLATNIFVLLIAFPTYRCALTRLVPRARHFLERFRQQPPVDAATSTEETILPV